MEKAPRYIKNSKLHQALDALSRQPLNESELKRKINFTASVIRFNQNIVVPLVNDKFVTRVHMLYRITPLGEEMLQDLGRIKAVLPATTKFVSEGDYEGKELSMACVRTSGDDHFMYPSRRNDSLFYRDGRVEAV